MSQESLLVILGAILNAGVSWATIKITLSWHRSDIDRAQKTADDAHQRINGLTQHS